MIEPVEDESINTAVVLLASAAVGSMSSIVYIGGGRSRWGFFCDFAFSEILNIQTLRLLEERMRTIAAEGVDIHVLNMVHDVAKDFLKHHGTYTATNNHYEANDIVEIVQLNTFASYSCGPCLRNTALLGKHLKLIRVTQRTMVHLNKTPSKVYRIEGILSADRQALKKLEKLEKPLYYATDPLKVGQQLAIYSITTNRRDSVEELSILWKDYGMGLLSNFRVLWERFAKQFALEKIIPYGDYFDIYQWDSRTILHLLAKKQILDNMSLAIFIQPESPHIIQDKYAWLMSEKNCYKDHFYKVISNDPPEKVFKAFSKTISDILMKLEIKFHVANHNPNFANRQKIESVWHLSDHWGQIWTGGYIKMEYIDGNWTIRGSLFGSIYLLIALVLSNWELDISHKKTILDGILS